jgi:hypothetical protein
VYAAHSLVFLGRIIGVALRNGFKLPLRIAEPLWKFLSGGGPGGGLRDRDRNRNLGVDGPGGLEHGFDFIVKLLRDLGVSRRHGEADCYLALGGDLNPAQEAKGDDITAEARVADLAEGLLDGILIERHEQD